MSTVTLSGVLTQEPEIRYTREGRAHGRIVVSAGDGLDGDYPVTAWDDLAENIVLSLRKGMFVLVTGRLVRRTWETDDGETRSVVEVEASDVGPSLTVTTVEVARRATV